MRSDITALIIDDDEVYSKKLELWLCKTLKTVETSKTAENGSYYVSTQKPDLVFLDNQLPKLLGSDVISFYKEMSPNSKIILMSENFDLDEIAEAIQNKADYVFNKEEITKEEIKAIVDAFEEAKNQKESIWRILKIFNKNKVESRKKNIALVEDDELFSFHLCWKLGHTGNKHTINSFSNGKSFYDFIKKSTPDIVFLDYYLPDSTGKEILDFLKKDCPNTKVIVVSSQDSPKIVSEFMKLGIHGYIVKNKDWEKKLQTYITELDL